MKGKNRLFYFLFKFFIFFELHQNGEAMDLWQHMCRKQDLMQPHDVNGTNGINIANGVQNGKTFCRTHGLFHFAESRSAA